MKVQLCEIKGDVNVNCNTVRSTWYPIKSFNWSSQISCYFTFPHLFFPSGLTPGWLYPLSFAFLLFARHNTSINTKLMMVRMKHGKSLMMTACTQKLILCWQQ